MIPPASRSVQQSTVKRQSEGRGERVVAEETPIAFTYGQASYAVMMATPADLEDFAVGFTLTEGIIRTPSQITELDVIAHPRGIELRMTLNSERDVDLSNRRRRLAGPVGCGLCGIESLEAAIAPVAHVASRLTIGRAAIFRALKSLAAEQALNQATHAVHGAGFWSPQENGFLAFREDVGRHNALDKLCGALARAGRPGGDGVVCLTSRVSIEMVQKTAALGAPILVAISAPTALAIHTAQEAGITLVGVARDDSFEIFTHPARITAS